MSKPHTPSLALDPIPTMTKEAQDTPKESSQAVHPISPSKQLPTHHQDTLQPLPITQQDVVRYRHRLKARLHRLVVPELPSKLETTEINSPLSDSALPQHTSTELLPNQPRPQVATHVDASTNRKPKESKAFVLAEAIAENDKTLHDTPKQAVPGQGVSRKSSSVLLLGGTVVAIMLVILLGLWATRNSQQGAASPRATQQSTKPITPPPAKITAEALKRDAQRKTDLSNLATALEVYKRQQGTYPIGNDISVVYPLQYTTPPYISYINYDPSSDNNTKIKYSYTSDGSSFTIAARLEDPSDPDSQSGYYIVKSK